MKKRTKIIGVVILFIAVACFSIYYYLGRLNNENKALVSKSKSEIQKGGYTKFSEFQTFPNGLIYSETTMNKLSHIVDSLNLKFKKCTPRTNFDSEFQTMGYLVLLEKRKVKQAKRDMENQIPMEDFIKKYPKAKIKKEVLILKGTYINNQNKEVVYIEHVNLYNYNSFSIDSEEKKFNDKDLQNKWLFRYNKKDNYSGEWIEAFYFPNQFTSKKLPQKYAQMMGYSNCLIDPDAAIYKKELNDSLEVFPKNWMTLSQKDKLVLLDRLRSTKIVAFCGMDSRPREQAIRIALVAAETANWEVFLMAHLNIMNDRFDRNIDNGLAQRSRATYIKELEDLNINVTDLLFGILFRVRNPAENQYFGNIGRVGRALSETKNQHEVEQRMLSIISDPTLDDYNRVLFYDLFLNYNWHIKDKKINKSNEAKLAVVYGKLPNYLKEELIYKESNDDF